MPLQGTAHTQVRPGTEAGYLHPHPQAARESWGASCAACQPRPVPHSLRNGLALLWTQDTF